MPILTHRNLNIIELQDCMYSDTIQLLRDELEWHASRNSEFTTHDRQEDERGLIVDRIKVYDTDWAKKVTAKLMTEKAVWEASADLRDYAWKAYYTTMACRFEVALSRYSDGQFYDWHCDHYMPKWKEEKTPLRILNFIMFLTDNPGGELDVSTEPVTEEYLEEYGFNFTPEMTFPPKVGDMVIFPSYYVHRVRPTVGVREVLHGHICL